MALEDFYKKDELQISDFKVGQIYKMNVASRSHVSVPYYFYMFDKNTTQTQMQHR